MEVGFLESVLGLSVAPRFRSCVCSHLFDCKGCNFPKTFERYTASLDDSGKPHSRNKISFAWPFGRLEDPVSEKDNANTNASIPCRARHRRMKHRTRLRPYPCGCLAYQQDSYVSCGSELSNYIDEVAHYRPASACCPLSGVVFLCAGTFLGIKGFEGFREGKGEQGGDNVNYYEAGFGGREGWRRMG